MLQNNTFSQFKKSELSYLYPLSFIFFLVLISFFFITNVYSAQVTIAWDPNSEPELAGYNLYCGSSSGNYDNVTDVSNQTSYTIQNLEEGQTYYFAVTAYSTFNNESDYSAEVVYIAPTQLDDDNDGVNNAIDQCPATPAGETVDAVGCSATQLDDDSDGVNNAIDQCPATPAGETVDANGCSNTQLDDDSDGVNNAIDQCPATPAGETVDAVGCSATQLDDDNDGVNNAIDQCPATPAGETVDANRMFCKYPA